MKRISDKRVKEHTQYRINRDVFLFGKTCEYEGCESREVEVHHKKGRSGKLIYDTNFFMAVCRKHHIFIENNPDFSRAKRHIINRLT